MKKIIFEKIFLSISFISISLLNFDIYISAVSAFYFLVITGSFLIKPESDKPKQNFLLATPAILLFNAILIITIPDIFTNSEMILFSIIFTLILGCYYLRGQYHEITFYMINIILIATVYSLVGANVYLIMWFSVFLILTLLFKPFNKIYSVSLFIFIIILGYINDTRFNQLVSLYFPELDYQLPAMAIGSGRATVVLKNKIIFNGQGELPSDSLFYENSSSDFAEYRQKPQWNDYTYVERATDIVSLSRNLKRHDDSYKMGIYTVADISPRYQKGFYFQKFRNNDRYYRLFSFNHKPAYLFRAKFSLMQKIINERFYNFFLIINEDYKLTQAQGNSMAYDIKDRSNKGNLSFKPQFLYRWAIPVIKTITIKTALNELSYFPANVISISPLDGDKNFNSYHDIQSLVTTGTKYQYKNIKVTYVDSAYIQFRQAYAEDLLLTQEQKDMIAKIAPETGILPTDSVYTKVNKIHNWFEHNFTYTLKLRYNGHTRTLEDFLLRDRQGHCEYFATTTALILRYYGIPSQYATGLFVDHKGDNFSGNRNKGHAWNLYWDGAGWLKTDNTVSTLSSSEPKWLSDFFRAYKIDFSFKFKPDNMLKFWGSDLSLITLLKTGASLLFITILFIAFLFYYRSKHRKKILEKQLRRDLKVYLKKYPKAKYIPWLTWATQIQEPFCIERVKQYYRDIYPLEK